MEVASVTLSNSPKENKRGKSKHLFAHVLFLFFKLTLRVWLRYWVWVRINIKVRVWVRFRVGVRAWIAIFLFLRHVTAASALKVLESNSVAVYAWFLRLFVAFWRLVANAQPCSKFCQDLSPSNWLMFLKTIFYHRCLEQNHAVGVCFCLSTTCFCSWS